MGIVANRAGPGGLELFHAAVLAGALPLFLAAHLCDHAYSRFHEIQWSNFASWLLIGAMVLATIALACALLGGYRGRQRALYLLLLVATWVVGFFAALQHGRDAWAIMPAAMYLTAAAFLPALLATWLAFAGLRPGGVR
ncbi:hypothetical protein MQC88_09330 [Luteimonas sp. 50]|uniref:Uncharacterized protein n=1 Tax=Cognatiluteimonas sedimenti TaxID=2927791 RepID=A0ABT0A5A9_9GAMM|nr:hypothetical protein [Lysobacter sedimenti]MCJ0826146.1 hypothetical protein [Lysobacter sedimenti]